MSGVFEIIAGVVTVISYIPYTRDIFARKVKPEPASWFLWSITGAIAFFSQATRGSSYSLWFPALDTVASLGVFFLSIKFGSGKFNKRDLNALKISGFGIILWVLSGNFAYALLFTMFIDAIGTVLTAWKTYELPYTETYSMWLTLWVASAAAILAVGKFDILLLAYPLYIFVGNLAIVGSIFIGRRVNKTRYGIPVQSI